MCVWLVPYNVQQANKIFFLFSLYFLKIKLNKKGALQYPTRKGKIGAPKKEEGEATTKRSADAHIILAFVI